MSHLTRLANSANSVLVKDMMIKLFEIDNERYFKFAKRASGYELEKCRELMKSISETQLKVLQKISFIANLRRQ
ncbi:hypothetical protein Tco_0977832 [Tanacetum coccineum]|uniref:Uncharacterized protein n=1 Tax=Tanacetum coccineum TaxID=301880 RepID=A0ABQ5EL80_9ASTR